jgi:hypothetical protein
MIMQTNATPLTAFHGAIRAILDDVDHETHTGFKLNEKMKAVLQLGQVRGYKLTSDQSSVEPALTPETNQKAFTLLVNKTALMFPRALTRDQIATLENDNYYLENY